jgi:NAD(P)-dependent dehydrogenase (short-subunit alcohol dehydrogenase family)
MTAEFGATSTTDDVLAGLDLKGKRVLATGTSSGLGIETSRALVAHGAYVVGTARDLDKAYATTGAVRAAAATSDGFELIEVDLGSLASVRACTDKLLSMAEPFDAVIANAGVMATLHGHTADGFETHIGTNQFDRRYKDRGVRAIAVHPGVINTGLTRHVGVEMLKTWMAGINAARAQQDLSPFEPKSVPQGAATSVWAAFTAPSEEIGGRYCEDCHVSIEFKAPQEDGISEGYRSYALNAARAAELWRKSEDLVDERY